MIDDSEVLTARYSVAVVVVVVVVVVLSMNGVAVHGNPCHPWMEYAIGGRKSR